ncbi:MAG: hypothetical protein ACKPKO_43575 [Candidatus Fonsibacter sp.]
MDNIRGAILMVDWFICTKGNSAWYKWHMTRDMKVPVYEWISSHLGYKTEKNTECMAILPDDFDEYEERGDDDIYVFLNRYEMQNEDSETDSEDE